MYIASSKSAYRRHVYSGPRKSLKRVRGGLRQFYDEESRTKVWRQRSENKKNPVNEEIVVDNNLATQNTKPRTYARVQQKIRLEATYSAPSTSTVTAEPAIEPSEINWPQADPETDSFTREENNVLEITNEIARKPKKNVAKKKTEVKGKRKISCSDRVYENALATAVSKIIARVYSFFKKEFEYLSKTYGNILDLGGFCKYTQRTSEATGFHAAVVERALREEGEGALSEEGEKTALRKEGEKIALREERERGNIGLSGKGQREKTALSEERQRGKTALREGEQREEIALRKVGQRGKTRPRKRRREEETKDSRNDRLAPIEATATVKNELLDELHEPEVYASHTGTGLAYDPLRQMATENDPLKIEPDSSESTDPLRQMATENDPLKIEPDSSESTDIKRTPKGTIEQKRYIRITELKAVYNCKSCGDRTMRPDIPCTSCDKSSAPPAYFKCPQCSFFTKNNIGLKLHMNIHMYGSHYKCTECPFSGKDLKELITHYTDVKNLICSCGYKTHIKKKMTAHQRSHTIERKYLPESVVPPIPIEQAHVGT